METSPQVVSLGDISRRLGKPIHRIDYVVRSRNIVPALIVGGRHFYNEAAVQHIASEIRRIEAEKAGTNHA
jgi:hypothetical protein